MMCDIKKRSNFAQGGGGVRLTDELMAEIAREYMRRMGIVNTQYIVCRHTDTAHPHLHIVANRVDNDGRTISDSNDSRRSVDICRQPTDEYGLHIANGKEKVRQDKLRGKDRIRYRIYDTVRAAALATCRSWSELDKTLTKQGIQIRFRYDTLRGRITGISFTADSCTFSGSKIDRSMSFYALDRRLGGRLLEADDQRLSVDSGQYRQRLTALAQSGRLVAPMFGESNYVATDSRQTTTIYSDGGNAIYSAGIVALSAVAVRLLLLQSTQPHPLAILFRLRSPLLSSWPCSRTKSAYLRAAVAIAAEAAITTKTRMNTNHDAEDNDEDKQTGYSRPALATRSRYRGDKSDVERRRGRQSQGYI